MPIELVKEDGTRVASADTYTSLDEFKAYCAKRGVTLPASDDALSIALVKGMDYIATYAGRFVGSRVSATQSLDWPRNGIYDANDPSDYPLALPDTYMPPKLIEAQCIAAIYALDADLLPTIGTEGFVTLDKVGPITTQYSKGQTTLDRPRLPAFDAAMREITYARGGLSVSRG